MAKRCGRDTHSTPGRQLSRDIVSESNIRSFQSLFTDEVERDYMYSRLVLSGLLWNPLINFGMNSIVVKWRRSDNQCKLVYTLFVIGC